MIVKGDYNGNVNCYILVEIHIKLDENIIITAVIVFIYRKGSGVEEECLKREAINWRGNAKNGK